MIEAGVRLDRALGSLERASGNPAHRRVLAGMRTSVEGGRTLTDVIVDMEIAPSVRALIAGGERIGRLGDGLRTAAELTTRLAEVRRQVRSAMVYPAVVLGVAILVLVVLSVSVVPQMERTFADLGGELPRATRIVVGIAHAIGSPWTWLVALASVAAWALSMGGRHGPPRHRTTRLRSSAKRAPLRRSTDIAVAARVIATLLAHGATSVDAFATAGGSAVHPAVRQDLLELAAVAASGRPTAETDAVGRLLHAVEREMLAVGEERGLLAQQWARIADRRLVTLERRLALLGTLAEPVLVVVVGLIVGGTVTALYLPSMKVLELI
jgi:type IV pilus assembly protein PilC